MTLALPRRGGIRKSFSDSLASRAWPDADVSAAVPEPALVYLAEDAPAAGTRHFYSTVMRGRKITTPVRIDVEHGTLAAAGDGPCRIRAVGASLVVAYCAFNTEGAGGRLKIRRSTDGGRTWGAAVTPAAVNIAGILPETVTMAKDGATVFVFWKVLAGGNVFFMSSADEGVTWTAATDTTLVGPGAKQGGEFCWLHVMRSPAGTWIVSGGDPATPNGGANSDLAVWRAAALTGPWGAAINIHNAVFARNQPAGIIARDGVAGELTAVFSYQNDFVSRCSSFDDGLTWNAAVTVNAGISAPFNVDYAAAVLAVPNYSTNNAYFFQYTHTGPIRVSVLYLAPNVSDLMGVTF